MCVGDMSGMTVGIGCLVVMCEIFAFCVFAGVDVSLALFFGGEGNMWFLAETCCGYVR